MPAVTVCEDGEADKVKSGGSGAFTTSVVVVLWLRPPSVPVMVSVYVPGVVPVVVLTDNVDEPPPLIEVGLKLPLAPEGRPLTLSETLSLKPLRAVVVAV